MVNRTCNAYESEPGSESITDNGPSRVMLIMPKGFGFQGKQQQLQNTHCCRVKKPTKVHISVGLSGVMDVS